VPQGKFLGTHYMQSSPQGYWMQAEGIGHLKISKEPTGNRPNLVVHCLQPSCLPLFTHAFIIYLALSIVIPTLM
jgi:hypothetical protein